MDLKGLHQCLLFLLLSLDGVLLSLDRGHQVLCWTICCCKRFIRASRLNVTEPWAGLGLEAIGESEIDMLLLWLELIKEEPVMRSKVGHEETRAKSKQDKLPISNSITNSPNSSCC
ncbi:uncharacterized protein EI90DRAFT_3019929 [Cantharellus anzutake]|uniref:uncharacterized protein n=1 Tax=Cantharellus anzutake TaxID=1750568 RepID=UPI0019063CB8|nr:uncharacterized protein EI90DRAFT_3019929 [Cantharellus anzutake]KAF8322936.1 hypothetical protein EI90DRAFT_3019929 [Cantharellus anzutake]